MPRKKKNKQKVKHESDTGKSNSNFPEQTKGSNEIYTCKLEEIEDQKLKRMH